MSTSTLAETKNNLSAIVSALEDGREREHVIKKRDRRVAVIYAYVDSAPARRAPFGFAKDDGNDIDFDAFDAMDREIAEEFGA